MLVITPAALAQESKSLRTWTDLSGRHKTEAAFVRLDGDSVQLRLASGRLISIALARLSKDDQQYVASLSEESSPAPATNAGGLKALSASSVVVWQQQGELATPTPGIVVRKEGEKAYVAYKPISENFARRSTESISYSVATDEEVASRVPAEWHSGCSKGALEMLAVPADRIPAPVPTKLGALPSPGDVLTVIGFQTVPRPPTSANSVQNEASLHRIFRTYEGTVANFRIEALPPVPVLGLVANQQGQFVGIVNSPVVSLPHRRGRGVTPPRFHSVELAPSFLEDLDRPFQVGISFAYTKQGVLDSSVQFVVYVADPFQRVRNPRLRIRSKKDGKDYRRVWDKDDPRMLVSDIDPLPLEQREPHELVIRALRNYETQKKHTVLVADFDGSLGGDLNRDGLDLQLVFETPDGKTRVERPSERKIGR